MNRRQNKPILIPSVVVGSVATALAVLTNTGARGTYVFALIGVLGVSLFVLWPEIRAQPQAKKEPGSSRDPEKPPRRATTT